MDAKNACDVVSLGPRESLLLSQSGEVGVHCLAGELWITEYGDSRDILLRPGQHWTLGRAGVVMSTRKGGRVALTQASVAGERRARGWWAVLGGMLMAAAARRASRDLTGRVPHLPLTR